MDPREALIAGRAEESAPLCFHDDVLHTLAMLCYGKIPPRPEEIHTEILREKAAGNTLRRELRLHLHNRGMRHSVNALHYMPLHEETRRGTIVGLCFHPLWTCTDDADIPPGDSGTRGMQSARWQIPFLLAHGFSVLLAPRNDFFADCADGRAGSLYRLFHPETSLMPGNREFTAISAWAAGFSLLREIAEPGAIWACGHSRLGKAALWAAAHDAEFHGVISLQSGCCGAALHRDKHRESEDIATITERFPWWFRAEFDRFAKRDAEFPVDQDALLAHIGPRPRMVLSASEDIWADPFNEYRALRATGALGAAAFPEIGHAIYAEHAAYALRAGKHEVTAEDWHLILPFLLRH